MAVATRSTPETESGVAGLLEFDTIKAVYLHGHKRLELISPHNWNMDFHFIERPNARRVQMDLFYDYRTNVGLYPKWQRFVRDHPPTTLIFLGQEDILGRTVRYSAAHYSQRSDFMGSIRTARRAGTKQAAIATSIRRKPTLA